MTGLCVSSCQAVVLPGVGPRAGFVGSEQLQKCQASQPRVAREAWLLARPVHPVFVAGNNRSPTPDVYLGRRPKPREGRECVQPCSCSASTTVSTCCTAPEAGIGPCCPGLAQSPPKPEVKSSCMSVGSSHGLTYCPSKAAWGARRCFTAAVSSPEHFACCDTSLHTLLQLKQNTSTPSQLCLANIQHRSTTALSIQSAPPPGMASKWELEAARAVLDGVSSVPLWMLWVGSTRWGRLCACQECNGELVFCACWTREQARSKPG